MNRLVYLFELDSVHKSSFEILKGQQALYHEIVNNGNIVVITMNQLTDSKTIYSIVDDERSYPFLLELFSAGSLKVSLYGNIRTASQYIQKAIKKCKGSEDNTFIFSNLPIQSNDKDLLKVLDDALVYSDLSVFSELIDHQKGLLENAPEAARDEINRQIGKLEYIKRFTNMILTLSITETSNNPPKRADQPEPVFIDYMIRIKEDCAGTVFNDPVLNANIAQAFMMLDSIMSKTELSLNNRSVWISQLNNMEHNTASEIAEIIINICYNYTVENSISNISKHYTVSNNSTLTFKNDLKSRIEVYWQERKEILQSADNNYGYLESSVWKKVSRIASYSNHIIKEETYENNFTSDRRIWHKTIFKKIGIMFILTIVYSCIFCITEWLLNVVQDLCSSVFSEINISGTIFGIVSIIIFGVIGSLISEITKMPDILECIKNFGLYLIDIMAVMKNKYKSYSNTVKERTDE